MSLIPYIIKTFRGGVSDENDKGIAGSFKHGYNLNIHKRNDSLSCGSTMVTVLGESTGVLGSGTGTTMTGIFNFFVPASDGSLYAFSDRGSIWSMSGDNQWIFRYNDENGGIKGAGEWEDSSGNNYLYWATGTSLARKPLPGAWAAPDSGTDRWTDATQNYKTTLVYNDWHTMGMASGQLMIANGEALASIDFSGNFIAQAMNIRPGNQIKALEERDDYVIMGSTREDQSEEGHIWSWVVTAPNYIQKKKIPVKGINSLIYTELPILQGGDDGELFYSDFSNVVPLTSIAGGGRTNPEGVSIYNDLAVFGIYGGSSVSYPGIWAYGRRAKNRPFSLNYEYRLSPTIGGSTISTLGAIINFNNQLIASWGTDDSHTSGTTTEYGVDQVSSTTLATAIYEGLEFDASKPYSKKLFHTAKVNTVALPSGTSYSIKFKLNKETDWRYAVLASGGTTYSTTLDTSLVGSTESEWQIGKPGNIFEIGTELNPSGSDTPEILSITTYIDGNQYIHG